MVVFYFCALWRNGGKAVWILDFGARWRRVARLPFGFFFSPGEGVSSIPVEPACLENRLTFLEHKYFCLWRQSNSGRIARSQSLYRRSEVGLWSNYAVDRAASACWPLVPKFAGSYPAEAVGFLGQKILSTPLLRRGSKAVGPMS
jgi:hypothetical protein